MYIYKYIRLVFFTIIAFSSIHCKKYLEQKPDKKIVIPETIDDLQALMDNANAENRQHPYLGEALADNYYVTYSDWANRTLDERSNYIWDDQTATVNSVYNNPYNSILYTNVVLEQLKTIDVTTANANQWNSLKGSALFFRAFYFFDLAQLYCTPYIESSASNDPGMPLRLNSDYNEVSVRASVKQTYDQIINDLKSSLFYLPSNIPNPGVYKTRPNKAAAYGLIARVFLSMEKYQEANLYADSCLQLYNVLIDYNSLDQASTKPLSMFNAEVIHDAVAVGGPILGTSVAKIDSTLYSSYVSNDLRKIIFFNNNGNGSYGMKASYSGRAGNVLFVGVATDEIYLIRAEAEARVGNKDQAMTFLNSLLQKRWKNGTFVPLSATTNDEALATILTERRKELLFRNLRWSDLRRLNRDSRFSKTLQRKISNGSNVQIYTLPPNDLRYVLLFPPNVISLSSITQNPR